MNRREALSAVTFLVGGTIIGAEVFLSGCKPNKAQTGLGFLSDDDVALLDEVGETIIPTTASSPGAKETKIGAFMESMVRDCYSEQEQKTFKEGVLKLDAFSRKKFNNGFIRLSPEEKHELLLDLEKEAAAYRKAANPETHYYTMMKQLTVWGYFSSEIGATKALRHVAVPGRYDACIPLKEGEKAWS